MDHEACSFIHLYLSSVCQYLSSLGLKHLKQLTELDEIFVFCDLCCICRLCLLLVELSTSTSAAVDVTTPPPTTTTEAETSSSYADVGTTSSTLGSTESTLAGNYCQFSSLTLWRLNTIMQFCSRYWAQATHCQILNVPRIRSGVRVKGP